MPAPPQLHPNARPSPHPPSAHRYRVLPPEMLQELRARLQEAEQQLSSLGARRDELQQQLDQAVELYNVVHGGWKEWVL